MSELDLLRLLGITGTSLATSIKVGDLFVRPKELQKHLGRYAQRFVSYRDDNVYEFQHIGTATGIRYRGRHFAISTDHQRRLGADGKLGIVCDPGQSMITPSFMRTLNFPNEADREDQHDFTVLEYEPEKYPNRQLSSQFFRVDFDSGVGQAVGRIALNLGYPTRLQNVDYHQRRVDLLVVSSYVELIGKTSSENVFQFKTVAEDRYFEDGMSESPLFEVYKGQDGFQVRLLGIVVRGGAKSRFGRVVSADYILRQIDIMIT